jgi:hypothetical protein
MEGQRAIVAVKWGPLQGQKTILEPGTAKRFGRAEWADFVVPHDRQMSGVHFEIAWDGAALRVRDLESMTGTFIDGEPGKKEGVIESGGWIKAGETVFTVHVEGASPTRDGDQPASEGLVAATKQALSALRVEAERGHLFAVLDAARDDRILELLARSVDEYRSLYDGIQGETMAEVAPYLARISPGSSLLDALVGEGWGSGWGIYLTSDAPFKEVRRHLRRFLMVEEEESGRRFYFRFYDPSALEVLVATCTPRQAEELYDEVHELLFEASETATLTRASRGEA